MRYLSPAELAFLKLLLDKSQARKMVETNLETVQVQTMDDGAMGSITFAHTRKPTDGIYDRPCDAYFLDVDGTRVEVCLLVFEAQLIELDVWKVDFSPLKQFPHQREQLHILDH